MISTSTALVVINNVGRIRCDLALAIAVNQAEQDRIKRLYDEGNMSTEVLVAMGIMSPIQAMNEEGLLWDDGEYIEEDKELIEDWDEELPQSWHRSHHYRW
jgi:hypothetical protein